MFLKKKIALALVLILAAGLLVGFTGETKAGLFNGDEKEKTSSSKLRFVDTGVEGMEQLQREFGPFRDTLEDVLDVEVEFFAVNDRTAAATAVQHDQVDLALTGPSEYIAMKSKADVKPVVGITRPGYEGKGYKSVFIVREDSNYHTLDDIKGKTIAMKDAGSTSGHIGPSSILIEEGYDLDNDFDIKLLGDARIEAFRSGDVDVLATGMKDYVKMVEQDGEDKYRLLYEGEQLPNDLIVASPEVSDESIEELQKAMIDNQEEILKSILVTGENDKYKEAKLVREKNENYEPIKRAYKKLGILED